MIEDLELLALFKAESAEHLANLDSGLLRLEQTPTEQALLEEMFREAHSLKGAARMLGLTKIENVTHSLELVLSPARKNEARLTPEDIEKMSGIIRQLRQLIQLAISGEPTKSISIETPVVAPVVEANETLIKETAELPSVEVVVEPAVISSPEKSPRIFEVVTPPPVVPLGNMPESPVASDENFHIETVRVETRKLDDLLTLVSELNVIDGRIQHQMRQMDALTEYWTKLERQHKKLRTLFRTVGRNTHIDETFNDNDNLFAQFSEQFKMARNNFYEDSTRLTTTVNTLEEQVHSVRLLPLSTLFALFPRMVHDLAKQQNKEVELVIEGGEIRVDKRIIEEMKDPLMHLLRNAIDHGIEFPEEREQQGKSCRSTLLLRARRENTTVLLEVRDNGRGLNIDAIKHTALKRRLYDEATLASMSLTQIQQLVLSSGFSTSHFITELSGHGVGLDVVRVNVEHIKGSVQLESVAGQGLAVQLRLPVSLAATRLLLATVNGQLYGLPVDFVHTSLRLRPTDIFMLEGRPAILLNNCSIVTAKLVDLLELRAKQTTSSSDVIVCIVIQVANKLVGLLVDELLSVEEVVPKPLGAPLRRIRNVSALAMLGSGEICVVLNPADLLTSMFKLNPTSLHSGNEQPVTPTTKATILLAEDSALIRAMEKRILEDGGYEVVTATDGLEAFNLLGTRSFSAVVTDIMMPNMDGLTLTQHIRAESRYKELPVILVTTLSSDEDKRRGLEVGANAYLPKPSFDQRTLLDTLKRLILT